MAAGWAGVHVDAWRSTAPWPSSVPSARSRRSSSLGDLTPDDVQVQLIHGPSGQGDELTSTSIVSMAPAGATDDGDHLRYTRHASRCDAAGRYGFTVRVVPRARRPRDPGRARPHRLGVIEPRPGDGLSARERGVARAALEEGLDADVGVVGGEDLGEELLLEVEAAVEA